MALRRWLVLGETTETSWCPDWYPVLCAAEALHTTPWEMLSQSVYWRDKALIKLKAERQARQIKEQHS